MLMTWCYERVASADTPERIDRPQPVPSSAPARGCREPPSSLRDGGAGEWSGLAPLTPGVVHLPVRFWSWALKRHTSHLVCSCPPPEAFAD